MRLGLDIGWAQRNSTGDIITATIAPEIQPIEDGEQVSTSLPASATDLGNYSSSEGEITSAVAEWSINGGAWITDGTTTVSNGDTLAARVTVSDDTGNSRPFEAGEILIVAWILTTGSWDDTGGWDDTDQWKDAA